MSMDKQFSRCPNCNTRSTGQPIHVFQCPHCDAVFCATCIESRGWGGNFCPKCAEKVGYPTIGYIR